MSSLLAPPDARHLWDRVVDVVDTLIIVLDPSGRVIRFNRSCEQLTGWSEVDLAGRLFWELLIPEDQREALRLGFLALHPASLPNEHENEWITREGSRRLTRWRNTCLCDEQGRLLYVVGTGHDVTAQVAARAELEQKERKYQSIFNGATASLLELDLRGLAPWLARLREAPDAVRFADLGVLAAQAAERIIVKDVNQAAVRLLEAGHREDMLGPLARNIRTETLTSLGQLLLLLASGERRLHREVRLEGLRGRKFWALMSVDLPSDERDLGAVVLSLLDVSDRKSLEERVRSAERLESIGRLAGGVAHDFNNLLTVIDTHVQFLAENVKDQPAAHQDAVVIREAAARASALTRQLLTFSRRTTPNASVVNVNDVLQPLLWLLGRSLGETVRIERKLDVGLQRVEIDPAQLEQAVMNLIVNARDAMPTGGVVHVQTCNEVIEPGDARLAGTPSNPGEFVQIAVQDDGMGMDEATQARLFEPFFTTKEFGKGTGLGLATVHGVVTHARGFVTVRSAPGRGTRIELHLPRAQDVPRARTQPPAAAHRGTLLLIATAGETEGAAATLRANGYFVLLGRGHDDALAALRAHDGPVDAVLVWADSPTVRSNELVPALLVEYPEIGVLTLMAAGSEAAKSPVRGERVEALAVPYTSAQLLASVRAVVTPR